MDAAASEFYAEGVLNFEGKPRTSAEMAGIYAEWLDAYPVVSIEDPLAEEDWAGWRELTATVGDRVQVVGDDLFVTNSERLRRGIAERSANSLLVKLNQIGSVTETLDAVSLAHRAGFQLRDQPPLRRDRRHDDLRPGRRHQLRPDQDRRARPRRARGKVQPAAQDRGTARRRGDLRGRRRLSPVRGADARGLMSPPAAPRATRLTGRAAVLAVVICAIALSLAYPIREYVNQRRQIDALVAQQQSMLSQVKSLQAQQARLSSPSYIEQLARQELDMCFPARAATSWRGASRGSARPRRPSRDRRPGTTSCGDRSSRRTRTRRARRSDRGADTAVIAAQLGVRREAFSACAPVPCGLPDVAETAPRLPDGSPFPPSTT